MFREAGNCPAKVEKKCWIKPSFSRSALVYLFIKFSRVSSSSLRIFFNFHAERLLPYSGYADNLIILKFPVTNVISKIPYLEKYIFEDSLGDLCYIEDDWYDNCTYNRGGKK